MATPKITLLRTTGTTQGSKHTLSIVVTNSQVVPKELFVITKNDRGVAYDTYSRTASLYDILNIKTDRTSQDKEYRSSSMSIEFDTLLELKKAYDILPQNLQSIVDFYKENSTELLSSEDIVVLE
jgi:hypothetical protein